MCYIGFGIVCNSKQVSKYLPTERKMSIQNWFARLFSNYLLIYIKIFDLIVLELTLNNIKNIILLAIIALVVEQYNFNNDL